MAEEEAYVRTCPRCNSPDTQPDFSNIGVVMGLDEQYVCNNCGYAAKLFPETPVAAFDDADYEVRTVSNEERNTTEEAGSRRVQYVYGLAAALAVYMIFFTPDPVLFGVLSFAIAGILVWEWWSKE